MSHSRFKVLLMAAVLASIQPVVGQQGAPMPSGPLKFGGFAARFGGDGTFALEGPGWPAFKGTWKRDGGEVELLTAGEAAGGCDRAGRYRVTIEKDNGHVTLEVVADACTPRRMILDRSLWRPSGEIVPVPVRNIVRTGATGRVTIPAATADAGSWPSFRGTRASGVAEGQHLPDRWDGAKGENVLWRTPIPATFRPGLYGDGDASDDRSRQRWTVYAIDKRTGTIAWERVAREGEPIGKRHIKSTYASATPATDGRIVVASFGSQGVYAYDVNGTFLWKVDLGHLDVGAYDIPTFEWGPASSPIIWNGLVILQCDTQADSFLLALKAETGETAWKTPREELPSWGTPTVALTPAGPQLVTNASNFIRGYDPGTGKELWRLGGSSKITAPTPVFDEGVFVIASGRAPERPIFVVRPNASGDVTLANGATSNAAVAWSRTGRGSYMPTPLIYKGQLYVLANNGVFDAYDLRTGDEIYRQRLTGVGNGFSASPVAADGRIYLSNEDGDMIVVSAGPEFKQLGANSMGELLMATPALSGGVMYVRTARSLFAIGRPPS